MIPQSIRSFVSRLRRETDVGTIEWHDGAENAYFCNHNEYTVHLSYSFDEDRELGFYRMTMASKEREASFSVNTEEGDIQEMRDLFSSAGVSAAAFQNIEAEFFK